MYTHVGYLHSKCNPPPPPHDPHIHVHEYTTLGCLETNHKLTWSGCMKL